LPVKTPAPQIEKSFLLLFFKKEGLPYLAELTNQRSLDTQVGVRRMAARRARGVAECRMIR